MTLSPDKGENNQESPEAAGPEKAAPEAAPTAPGDLQELQRQLEDKTKEAQEHYERMLRLAADLENLKKRLEREKTELLQFANEKLIKELLPVVDHLELALEHGRQLETPAPFLEGITNVHQGLLSTLARFGVTPLESVGKQFDPAFHDAVLQEETADAPDCTVLKELQKGYLLHNRLIRPAMVVVARKPETSAACTTDTNPQEEK